jgi:hypothetical protein
VKPDLDKDSVDFKYFNLKQQSVMESALPAERVDKIMRNKQKFKDFDKN